ncbi:MAG: hypothetical protein NTW32_22680 [Chloroflexi bacterium]|nr:hypothetical protein [Chloroflexota bacterium]
MSPKKLYAWLVIAGVAIIGLSFFIWGYENTWHLWNLPTVMPPFLDFRLITGGAESIQAGYDPRINNPFDPGTRLFNYPQIWFIILKSGINLQWTIPLAILTILLFIISVISFPGEVTKLSGIFLLAILFSPAILLGVERCNVDLLVFSCMALALLVSEQRPLGSFLILMIGIVFKLFPLFGIGFFLGLEKKKALKLLLATLACSILYFASIFKDMLHLAAVTQKGITPAYGWLILPEFFYTTSRQMMMLKKFNFLFLILLIGLSLGTIYLARKKHQTIIYAIPNSRNLRAFWLGAGVYVGTFLLGNNWDYRLMFLIFCTLQLAEWSKKEGSNFPIASRTTSIMLFISCWNLIISKFLLIIFSEKSPAPIIIDEIANWLLFVGLLYLLVGSLPSWVHEDTLIMLKNSVKRILHLRKSKEYSG